VKIARVLHGIGNNSKGNCSAFLLELVERK